MTEEGSRIVESMLQDWADRCASLDSPMGAETETDREIALLRESVDKYRDVMTSNPWIQSLVAAL